MTALPSFAALPINACVFGASGGIGGALVRLLINDPSVAQVHAGSRQSIAGGGKLRPFTFDLTDEATIQTAAQTIAALGPLNLVIIATGLLHDGDTMRPERSYRSQTADAYARAFALNATGPALIGKHFLPLLPRDGRSVFAALSARVSSVSDNHLGGWHAYRAAKAALNMIVRNFAIELARTHRDAIAVTLHPGTVATDLSQPFQRNVVPEKLFTPAFSANKLLAVLDGLEPSDSGSLFAWDSQRIAF